MIHRTGKRLKYSVFWLEGKYFGSLQQPIINYLDCFFYAYAAPVLFYQSHVCPKWL